MGHACKQESADNRNLELCDKGSNTVSNGQHYSCFHFKFLEWLVQFRSPFDILKNHGDFLRMEITTFVCCALTVVHGKLSPF